MIYKTDTIFALASGAGKAGVAVVRVSGPGAGKTLLALAPALKSLPQPRELRRIFLFESESSPPALIDDGMAVYFAGPASFTGEDVVEFHVHGGAAVLDALFTSLSGLGLRVAEPGEFSRRAFLNGKMDLTAVEAVADLVDAETTAQRRQALTQMGGALAGIYDGWRARLIGAMAFAEARIDFAEEDIPDDLRRRSLAEIAAVAEEITRHLDDHGIGERIRRGVRIALTGPPNVGKSSLLNTLARRDAAIVSDIAGTTRDIIEVPMDLGGYAVTVIDTAGLRDTQDVIEQEGVKRARAAAETADLRIVMAEAGGPVPAGISEGDIVVVNKSDVSTEGDWPAGTLFLSVKSGAGMDALVSALTEKVRSLTAIQSSEAVPLTRARHRRGLEECAAALRRIVEAGDAAQEELAAEDLRLAGEALGRLTGRIDVEDILDRIFRDFCIGK